MHPAMAWSSPPLAMNRRHDNNDDRGGEGEEGSGDGDGGSGCVDVVVVGGGGGGGWLTFMSGL